MLDLGIAFYALISLTIAEQSKPLQDVRKYFQCDSRRLLPILLSRVDSKTKLQLPSQRAILEVLEMSLIYRPIVFSKIYNL